MTTHPFQGDAIPSSLLSSTTVPIETKHLVFYRTGDQRYVTLRSIAKTMAGLRGISDHAMQNRLDCIYAACSDLFSVSDLFTLPSDAPPDRRFDTARLALNLPAAIKLMARSRAREFLTLHDVLVDQLAAACVTSHPFETE